MMRLRINRTWLFIAILGIACLLAMTWLNFSLLASPFAADSAFILPYTAAKAFFSEGTSPYDEALLTRADVATDQETKRDEPEHTERFLFPLFAAFLYAPFTWIQDPLLAFAAFLTFLECCIAGGIAAAWRMLDWKAPPAVLVMFIFFSATSYFVIQPLVHGNIVLAVSFFFLAGLLALHYRYEELAAILMSLTFIKPHLLILPVIFLLVWTIFQRRWRFIIWLVSMTAILVFFSVSLLPDWIIQNLREAYRLYQDNQLTLLLTSTLEEGSTTYYRLTYLVMGILAVLVLLEWFFARRSDFTRFLWVISLSLVVNQMFLTVNNASNLALLYLPVAMILTSVSNRLGKEGSTFMQFILGCVLLVPWFLQVLGIMRARGDFSVLWQIPVVVHIALLTMLTLGLYWVRWWIIHPLQFLIEKE